MKTAASPESYRYCIFFDSVRTGRNFSPARKVLSITEPSSIRRSLVRTKAPPLPGFTCWKSMILKIVPSISMWDPFLNWLVEITAGNPRDRPPSGGTRLLDREEPPLTRRALQLVGAAFGELEARTDDELADGAGDEDLAGAGEGADAGADVDRHAADVVADQLDLPGVDADADVDVDLA